MAVVSIVVELFVVYFVLFELVLVDFLKNTPFGRKGVECGVLSVENILL